MILGTSCKDLSNMQHKPAGSSRQPVFALATSPGGSADTFRAFLGYLDAVNASWFVWENVDLAKSADGEVNRVIGQ